MEMTIIYIVVVAGGIAAVGALVYSWGRTGHGLKLLAEEFGLDHEESWLGPGSLHGRKHGCEVQIALEWYGQNEGFRTVYRAEVGSVFPESVELAPENTLSSIGQMMGAQDVEVGEARFDEVFVVKADEPDQARRVLDQPGVGDALLELEGGAYSVALRDGTLEVQTTSFPDDPFALKPEFETFFEQLGRIVAARENSDVARTDTGK